MHIHVIIYIYLIYIHTHLSTAKNNKHTLFPVLNKKNTPYISANQKPAAFTGWINAEVPLQDSPKHHKHRRPSRDHRDPKEWPEPFFVGVFFVSRVEEQKKDVSKRKAFFQIWLCLEVTCGRWFGEEVEKTWGNNSKLILSDTPSPEWFGQIHFE